MLLSDGEKALFIRRLRAPKLDSLQRMAVVKAVHEKCRKVVDCMHCGALNGIVKKVGIMKVVHEKYRPVKRNQSENDAFKRLFVNAVDASPEIKMHLGKAQEDLNPLRALELFERISLQDCELLGLDPLNGHPRSFLWTQIPVPPACIRPSVAMSMENGSNEDDLTIKLTEIVYTNLIIKDAIEKGSPVHMLMVRVQAPFLG